MQRHSEKRDAILKCLQSTKDHPSAEWIYGQLKPLYPNLSLATVYRNLNQLKESGRIQSMGEVLGQERFDACILPHTHAVCKKCGRVVDVEGIPLPEGLAQRVQRETGFNTDNAFIQLFGICPECAKKP